MVPRFVLHILLHFAAYGTQISLQTDVDEFALEIDNFANINLGAKKCQVRFLLYTLRITNTTPTPGIVIVFNTIYL